MVYVYYQISTTNQIFVIFLYIVLIILQALTQIEKELSLFECSVYMWNYFHYFFYIFSHLILQS